jgi:hypothetical protein
LVKAKEVAGEANKAKSIFLGKICIFEPLQEIKTVAGNPEKMRE